MNDTRSGVMLVYNHERLVTVWAQCYQIDRSLQQEEHECRLRVRIHRGNRGVPILVTKRGKRSSFLTGSTLRRFERETGLQVRPVDLDILNGLVTSEYGCAWAELDQRQRLQILERIAGG